MEWARSGRGDDLEFRSLVANEVNATAEIDGISQDAGNREEIISIELSERSKPSSTQGVSLSETWIGLEHRAEK